MLFGEIDARRMRWVISPMSQNEVSERAARSTAT
jgi:hypothetical protein